MTAFVAEIPKLESQLERVGVRIADPGLGILECRACGNLWLADLGSGRSRPFYICPNLCNSKAKIRLRMKESHETEKRA